MDLNRFSARPPIQRLLSQVTPKSRLLHTSEWRVRMEITPAVHSDLAGLNCGRDSVRTADVISEDCGAEAVF